MVVGLLWHNVGSFSEYLFGVFMWVVMGYNDMCSAKWRFSGTPVIIYKISVETNVIWTSTKYFVYFYNCPRKLHFTLLLRQELKIYPLNIFVLVITSHVWIINQTFLNISQFDKLPLSFQKSCVLETGLSDFHKQVVTVMKTT